MWVSELHWSEFVVRGVVVYAFLLLLLRLTGKRQVGQMSPFDLVLLLVLSNAVQNSMNGGDNTITGDSSGYAGDSHGSSDDKYRPPGAILEDCDA